MTNLQNNQEFISNIKKKVTNYGLLKFDNFYLLEYQDQLFYLKNIISENQVNGILFQTTYDENQNPIYLLQEGNFLIEIRNGKIYFLLNDQNGIEYQGKSKQIKYQGYFLQGQYQPINEQLTRSKSQNPKLNKKKSDDEVEEKKQNANLFPSLIKQGKNIQQQNVEQPTQIRKIIITDANSGEVLNNDNKRKQKNYFENYNFKVWCKYNQQITSRDIEILDSYSKSWVTSNILDGYCFYLNQHTDKQYFSYQLQQRKYLKRILFVPSSLTSSFWDSAQAYEQCRKEFLQFETINYQLTHLYTHIGFIINKNKSHWQFLLVDLQNDWFEIFDSLGWQPDTKIINNLREFLNHSLSKNQKHIYTIYQCQQSKQQKDGYSCGYHVACFMKYLQEKQFSPNTQYNYSEIQIKTILKGLLKN